MDIFPFSGHAAPIFLCVFYGTHPSSFASCQEKWEFSGFAELTIKFIFTDLPARPIQPVSHILYLLSPISYLIYIIVSPPSGTPFRAPPEGFSFTGFCYKFYPVSARNFYLQKEENP